MRLAEALILRADAQKRVEQLKMRLARNAKVQEGDEPAEAPALLLEEVQRVTDDLLRLIQRINATNVSTWLDEKMTLADAIALRDILKMRFAIYRELAQAATVTQDRYTKSEVKFKGTVNVADVQQKADECALQHRKLDARIQEINWQTDLLE